MISPFLENVLKFFKETLTKSEFNPKLIDLKAIEFEDIRSMNEIKHNPIIKEKGLLLDENKGKYKLIDMDSDSNYNKLETSKNIKALKPSKIQIKYESSIDYLKKIIFGNRNQENLKYFFKFCIKPKDPKERPNNNFSFNSNGKLIGFINQDKDVIITNIESNEAYSIKSNDIYVEGIITFSWDLIYPNKLYFSSNDILYECIINERDLNLFINKCYNLSKFSKFINCFPSPKGDLLIFLYEKGIEVYDIFHNLIFSKIFFTFKFLNGLYNHKSSIFIIYTEKKLIIFNIDSFDFKAYSYFYGNILKVINNPESDNIYVFTVEKSNELYMYTLTDISASSDTNFYYNSYQNCDNFYSQCHYVLRPDIFTFQHKLKDCNIKILDICLSPNEFRLGILYKEEFSNQNKQNSLYIFALTKDKRDNNINQGILLYDFGHVEGNQIVSFEFNKMLKNENTFLVVRFEKDIFIKTEKIKG
jgi:hypothetical protein